MLFSYLLGTRQTPWPYSDNELPTVLEIQQLIEKAWERGYNPKGRDETGGILGSRKFIGTPEVA